MEEEKPLLEAKNLDENINDKKCISTRMRVMIYVMINTIGLLVSGSAQTQFVYAYVKKNYDFNNTDVSISVNLSNNTETCGNSSSSDDKIQGYASQWNWYISLVEYGICLPVIIIAGPMVDRIGRKPLLLWNTMIMFISFVIKSVVIYYNMNLFYFMIGSGVEGISGTFYTFHLANLAILADTTTKGKDRTWIMTVYDALLGLGAFFSYVGTGYLIQLEGYLYPFVISSGIFLAFFIIIALTLEDTWKRPTTHTKLTIFEIPVQICSLCTVKRNTGVQLNYFLINLFIFLIVLFPLTSYSSIRTIYTLGWPFCWTSEHIGWYSAGCDLIIFILGALILKIMQSFCVLIKDEWIVVCGCFSSCVSFVLLGFSQTDWMLYVATVASILRVLPIPLLKAIMSRIVHPEKQGALFSNIYLIEATCALAGSTLFNNIYQQTVTFYKGMVFFIMAAFSFSALMLMMGVTCKSWQKVETEIVIDEPEIQNKKS